MIKVKDVIKNQQINTDECELCEVHRIASETLQDGIECPFCGHAHSLSTFNEAYTVVGETNGPSDDESIGKYIVHTCDNCRGHFALMPHKINWNANHDVYYTGGKDYLNDDDENKIFQIAQENIQASLKQYHDRLLAGEKLDPMYPALWIKRHITGAIAKYLYEKGLKR